MPPRVSTAVALLSATLAAAGNAAAEPAGIAVLPVQNSAGLDPAEADYLSDLVRGAAAGAGDGRAVAQAEMQKALGKRADRCDEGCALDVGRKVGAVRALLVELRAIGGGLRATVKLLDVRTRSLERMEKAGGADLASLEGPLERAVAAVLAGKETPAPVSVASEPPTVAPVPGEPLILPAEVFGEVTVRAEAHREGRPEDETEEIEAEVHINGRFAGKTPFEDGLPPGTYRIEIRRGGRAIHGKTITVTGGASYAVVGRAKIPMSEEERRRRMEQHRRALEEKAREAEEAAAEIARREAIGRTQRGWGAGLITIGGALGLAGGITGIVTLSEYNRLKNECGDTADGCSSSSIEENHTKAVATNWLLGAAGVSLLTGIIVYAAAPSWEKQSATAAPVAGPTPDGSGIAVGVTGRF
jgi:hypothetical protein